MAALAHRARKHAMEMLLTGEMIPAEDAFASVWLIVWLLLTERRGWRWSQDRAKSAHVVKIGRRRSTGRSNLTYDAYRYAAR
jgi:hypothetical protein